VNPLAHRHLSGFRNGKPQAFTLIELLVVIAITAILASLLFNQVSAAKARANSVECLANLKQIGMGFHLYANDNNEEFPLLNAGSGDTKTWMIRVAPYLGVQDGVLGLSPLARAVPPFICPDWKMDATRRVSYAVNDNIRRASYSWNYRRISVPQSSTFLVTEIAANQDSFNPATDGDVQRRHPNKSANFLFVDGHAENFKESIPATDPRWFGR